MVNIVRQKSETHSENYYVHIDKDKHWELSYSSYSYPDERHKKRGAVDASIRIREAYLDKTDPFIKTKFFEDTIYLIGGKIGVRIGGQIGYSPVFDGWSDLETGTKKDILESLSSEARTLMEFGLKYYDNVKKGS